MTEEFIPRDIPIYCFSYNNEMLDRVKQIRDKWTQRWGFTNFIIQENVSSGYYFKSIERSDLYEKFKRMQSYGREGFLGNERAIINLNSRLNLAYLAKKIRTKEKHAIIIQYNTILKNDIPISALNNDITFFDIGKGARSASILYNSGIMMSPSYARSHCRDVKNFFFSNEEFILDNISRVINFDTENFRYWTTVHEDCRHNYFDLIEKTKEEMYGTTI